MQYNHERYLALTFNILHIQRKKLNAINAKIYPVLCKVEKLKDIMTHICLVVQNPFTFI